MPRPTFRRFWIRILPDGRAIPQFDPVTGKYCGFEDFQEPVAQVLFYPVTRGLAEKIQARGDRAEASNLPILSFEALPGSSISMHRAGTLRYDLRQICGFCEAEFEPELGECPRCLAKSRWYCSKCDELKLQPIIDLELQKPDPSALPSEEDGVLTKWVRLPAALEYAIGAIVRNIPGRWGLKGAQVRCPDCEQTEPRGLRLAQRLEQFYDERLFTHYALEIDGHRHVILDYKLRR